MNSLRPPITLIRFRGSNLGKWISIRMSVLSLITLGLVGCNGSREAEVSSASDTPDSPAAVAVSVAENSTAVLPAESSPVEQAVTAVQKGAGDSKNAVLLPLDWPQIQKQILMGTPDRYTIVDFWSLSCAPCLKELPELARLSREDADRFRCVGVSLDFNGRPSRPPEYYAPKIESVLRQMNAEFENVICQTVDVEMFANLDIPSTPAVLVLDREGQIIKRFADGNGSTGFTYQDDVLPFLATLD